jgi:DNA polymerase-3 subunit alpha
MIATKVNESLKSWIEENQLTANFLHEKILEIEGVGKFLTIEPKNLALPDGTKLNNVIFDTEFQITISDEESELVDEVDYLLFQFGNRWYYVNDLVPEEIKEFKYLGKANLTFFDTKFPYLGVHGGFELTSGSRLYSDWVKKAQFLGVETLGICEENTLAGTLAFQDECLKNKIKPIIGETITILTTSGAKMHIKLFVENEEGWINLLKINKMINVDNSGEYLKEEQLFNKNIATEGLILVLTPDVDLEKYWNNRKFDFYFSTFYYQLDFSEWSSNERDEKWLKAIKHYFDKYLMEEGNNLQPILLCDSYYLDKNDHEIRKILNNIGKGGFKFQSKDQHFKSIDEIYLQFTQLFREEDERWSIILDLAIENLNAIVKDIRFKIPTGDFRLPEYEMTELEQAKYKDGEELFFNLIGDGFEDKIVGKVDDESAYFDRLQEEIDVIKRGGFISYFLMLRDIINWCKSQGIWVGMGRGSAAGSLVSYLLDIVKIDPIHYKLLFSRFLNAGRIGKSLPDVDLDFEGGKRDDVKRYMESRYGKDYVTAIGTYGTFKIKSALKDLCRDAGVDYSKTNYVASLIDDAKITFTGLFKLGAEKADIKQFLQKNYKVIERMPLCLNQVKNSSIHASGVVVVPKSQGLDIYSQMPVKQIDGVLVSEWEGTYIDKAGFLKFDILGVKQLDKFAAITKLIKDNKGVDIDYDSMDLSDPEVYELFKEGYTEDVFQFGTQGLKAYCKEMKPDNIEDLIAAVALYRPGTMDTGMHKKYIKIKHGIDKPIYDDGTYNATKETFGIAVYQEQVMQITKDVAGFDLVTADDVRKAMGKKDKKLMEEYKGKFIEGGKKNGYTNEYLVDLWSKLETFAGYGFNRSHAACYAIMGYFSQWLKAKYPVEFWTVALQFSSDEEIINRISEINKISNISIEPVDINKSTTTFYADYKTNKIYWAMNSIKWVGDKAVEEILQERKENGEFFDIEEFCDRMKTRKEGMKENDERSGINKRTITNLILAGAFDKVEKITPEKRGLVIKKYYNFANLDLSEELIEAEKWKPYQWVLKQKELTGFGYIDFQKIVAGSKLFAAKQKLFYENSDILYGDDMDGTDVVIAGIVQKIFNKPFKGKGNRGLGANLEIIDNNDLLRLTIWMDKWEDIHETVIGSEGKIMIFSGKVSFDSYRQMNCVQSNKLSKVEII